MPLRASLLAPLCFLLLLQAGASNCPAASLPEIQWESEGGVDWSSGYVISYGSGSAPSTLANHNLRRRASGREALRQASRRLFKYCLGLRVDQTMTVRDYFNEDPELQESIRRLLMKLPPWEIQIGSEDRIRVALKFPLGGKGGFADILGEPREENFPPAPSRQDFRVGTGLPGIEESTGLILMLPRELVVPALRPTVRGAGGETLLDYGRASEQARARPAYIAYYNSLEKALEDPLIGDNPLVVTSDMTWEKGTDLTVSSLLEGSVLGTPEGRKILSDVKIVVVLRE